MEHLLALLRELGDDGRQDAGQVLLLRFSVVAVEVSQTGVLILNVGAEIVDDGGDEDSLARTRCFIVSSSMGYRNRKI